MSFRKRNTVISATHTGRDARQQLPTQRQLPPGLRPSPLDGRLTTSTGTSSLDHLLAGHVGLPLGTSLLIEEQGTTDFAGVLLRYYAAEGLVQGHRVHVLGFPEPWKHDLPALKATESKAETARPDEQKMKIAWRYEALGNKHSQPSQSAEGKDTGARTFCHSFDLAKRLSPRDIKGVLQSYPSRSPTDLAFHSSPSPGPQLMDFVKAVRGEINAAGPSVIHRVIVPSLLSPTLYAPSSCRPSEVLQFLHSLRALLRQYSAQLTALVTLPSSLFPRSNGLTRWMELLSDGVIELVSLSARPGAPLPDIGNGGAKSEDRGQGLLRVHSLPVHHEKGGGGAENNHFRENLTFSLSASKGMVIKPFSLPPLGEEGLPDKSPAATVTESIEF